MIFWKLCVPEEFSFELHRLIFDLSIERQPLSPVQFVAKIKALTPSENEGVFDLLYK